LLNEMRVGQHIIKCLPYSHETSSCLDALVLLSIILPVSEGEHVKTLAILI
jgi:hypothetical protein